MTQGERVRKAREALGLTREDMASKLDGFTANKIYDIEADRTKLNERKASQISYTFGISLKWLLDEVGEMMADAQHLKNLRVQLFERGILNEEEWKMMEALKRHDIKTVESLEGILRWWNGTTKAVAETTAVKYKSRRK